MENKPTSPRSKESKTAQPGKPFGWMAALVFNSLLLPFAIAVDLAGLGRNKDAVLIIALISLPVLVLAIVYACIVHYRCWKAVDETVAATSPGRAVGYLFIPFFSFYWVFVSYPELQTGLGRTEFGSSQRPPEKGLGITIGILFICSWTIGLLPGLGSILCIAGFVIWILFTRKVVAQANRIIARTATSE